jgi:hypothetical protein
MLNGRYYGTQSDPNPFANARDDEPEFVEWGYGGMGSAKSDASTGSHWSKLQSGRGVGSVEDEDDDGGGMGWVRKRREQREREKREREEREKAANGIAEDDATVVGSQAAATSNEDDAAAESTSISSPSKPSEQIARAPLSQSRLPTSAIPTAEQDKPLKTGQRDIGTHEERHHVLTASVPVLHRHGSNSRRNSITRVESPARGGIEKEFNFGVRSTSPLEMQKVEVGDSESDDEEDDSTEDDDEEEEAEVNVSIIFKRLILVTEQPMH